MRLSNKFLKDNLFSLNLYNKSYFEATRRMKKRSLLGVNEDFRGKRNDKVALLDSFFLAYVSIARTSVTPKSPR